MSDIDIQITGPRGVGKTTFAKYLFNLLVNTTYVIDEVQDTDPRATQHIVSVKQPPAVVRRMPRSVSIRVIDKQFFEKIEIAEDEEDEE